MFEPLTLTLAELAARWSLTPRQVLQHAQQPGVPLYFAFEGLVFDVGDRWHRHGGDWRQTERSNILTNSIQSGEAWLRRRKEGQLTKWDALSNEEATKLRAEIEASKIELRQLDDVLQRRTIERNDRHFRGFLRAAPATLWDIESIGTAPFPHKAFHPSAPVKVVRLSRAPRDGEWVWDGRLVSLEPLHEGDRHWKKQLTPDDLVAITTEVKAIEAMTKARAGAQDPDPSESAANPPVPKKSVIAGRKAAILSWLKNAGYDPLQFPKFRYNAPGGKAAVKDAMLETRGLGFTDATFEKAWEEMRSEGAIRDRQE